MPRNCLSVFDFFVGLALKGLNQLKWNLDKLFRILRGQYQHTQLYLSAGFWSPSQTSFFLICAGDSAGAGYCPLVLPRPEDLPVAASKWIVADILLNIMTKERCEIHPNNKILTKLNIANNETQLLRLNSLQPGIAYLYPLKTSENLKVIWCFQGL